MFLAPTILPAESRAAIGISPASAASRAWRSPAASRNASGRVLAAREDNGRLGARVQAGAARLDARDRSPAGRWVVYRARAVELLLSGLTRSVPDSSLNGSFGIPHGFLRAPIGV